MPLRNFKHGGEAWQLKNGFRCIARSDGSPRYVAGINLSCFIKHHVIPFRLIHLYVCMYLFYINSFLGTGLANSVIVTIV